MSAKAIIFFFLFLFITSVSFSQRPDSYCYYPSDKSKITSYGAFSFYVSSFSANNISNTEFVILQNGKQVSNTYEISFTSDAPAQSVGKKIDFSWTSNNTIRLSLDPVIKEKNTISVYLNNKADLAQYAGPITFLSSNRQNNPGYEKQCADANQDVNQISTSLDWNFKAPGSIKVGDFMYANNLNYFLAEQNIIPTKSMTALLKKINPDMPSSGIFTQSATLVLPRFPAVGETRQSELERQYEIETAPDEIQNTILNERIRTFDNFFRNAKIIGDYPELQRELIEIDQILLRIYQKPGIVVKKYEADLLNSEIETFNDILFDVTANQGLKDFDISFAQLYKRDISILINDVQKKSPLGKERRGPAPGIIDDEGADATNEITANIYVFENDVNAPDNSYWIYCLNEWQFSTWKRMPSYLNQLSHSPARCQMLASTTARTLNPSFTYYFLAVAKDGKVVDYTEVKASELPENSKPGMKLYAIVLYNQTVK